MPDGLRARWGVVCTQHLRSARAMCAQFIRSSTLTFEHEALSDPLVLTHTPEAVVGEYEEADGTFARLWPTALVLARYLCENPSLVAGQRVIELGAGSGAVGLVCAALGATSVTLTDVPEALPLIESNVAHNPRLASRVRAAPCTWGDEGHREALLRDGEGYDVVLCCEVVYQQSAEVLRALAHTQLALARPLGKALLAYEFRSAISEDLAYFDAATDLFGDSTAHSLAAFAGTTLASYMGGREDDSADDRFLYVYTVPERRLVGSSQ